MVPPQLAGRVDKSLLDHGVVGTLGQDLGVLGEHMLVEPMVDLADLVEELVGFLLHVRFHGLVEVPGLHKADAVEEVGVVGGLAQVVGVAVGITCLLQLAQTVVAVTAEYPEQAVVRVPLDLLASIGQGFPGGFLIFHEGGQRRFHIKRCAREGRRWPRLP